MNIGDYTVLCKNRSDYSSDVDVDKWRWQFS